MQITKMIAAVLRRLTVYSNSTFYRFYIKTRYPNVVWGSGIRVYGKLIMNIDKTAEVVVGDNVVFRSNTKSNFVGINKPVSIAVKKNAKLKIGAESGFSGTSIYAARSIEIGKYCNFGGNTFVWDTDFHPIDYQQRRKGIEGTISKSIIIGDDVFVGANSTVLKGSQIGARSIIGACSVVSRKIGSDEIWAGNPVKFIKSV